LAYTIHEKKLFPALTLFFAAAIIGAQDPPKIKSVTSQLQIWKELFIH
jgi:hypothetical protein